ncbi:hypothetical protein H4219_002604 [Mycoemilia scoparia]|uniref:superoxide dismutase n=1 Tax=Mycoemilia scoparia TaxID=417184 RepID=A0A9W8DTV0_9FUNG|nr:hypothetical protein H4219_002604 [Mycoemilia scoparia]
MFINTASKKVATGAARLFPRISKAKLHQVALIPYSTEEGLDPLFSQSALELLYNERQTKLINNVNRLVSNTPLENESLLSIIGKTAGIPDKAALYNNSSQAWNNDFFLQTLTSDKRSVGEDIKNVIAIQFDGFDMFQMAFAASANNIFGNGWTWLLMDREGRLSITNTYNSGSPFALFPTITDSYTLHGSHSPVVIPTNTSYTDPNTAQRPFGKTAWSFQRFYPILCLNVWQEAYLLDYGLNKSSYIDNFWKVVNWDIVRQRLFKNVGITSRP